MHNWVNSLPEVIILILMLLQFLFLWGIIMFGMGGKTEEQA